ncbi:PREDICTED: protein SSUH2 homolog [Pterocles gutturalis]|uniref:protein SSUH2 homolog n=1 Tax=Pterocles gutturalis TaxID=240206 RepID=UPI0005283A10|nr:PREDICTED: protein SSUH2 homolog [Pterocles gutturalis]
MCTVTAVADRPFLKKCQQEYMDVGTFALCPLQNLWFFKQKREVKSLFLLPCSVPAMTEAVARRALLRFMGSWSCVGCGAGGDLAIQHLRHLGTYRVGTPQVSRHLPPGYPPGVPAPAAWYRLETFSESRLSEWAFEPFTTSASCTHSSVLKGTLAFLPSCGEIAIALKEMCNTCSGRGSKTCATCRGGKKLQHFEQLVITWKNNVFEFVSEHHLNFPAELLCKVSGENVFKDENVVVYPIIDFPHPAISLASQRAAAEHSAAVTTSSRGEGGHTAEPPRQSIERIPITEVQSQHAGKPCLYYIYGLENKVYARDYPGRCCCGCALL